MFRRNKYAFKTVGGQSLREEWWIILGEKRWIEGERVTGTEHRPKIQKARERGGWFEREKGNLERKREGGKWDGGSFKDTHKKLPSLISRWWLQSETQSEDCSSRWRPVTAINHHTIQHSSISTTNIQTVTQMSFEIKQCILYLILNTQKRCK